MCKFLSKIMQKNNNLFNKKIIAITGGTGSFGSMFLSQIVQTKFNEIRVISRDEDKQFYLRKKFNNDKIKFLIGDVKDKDQIISYFKNVDIVIHAAALKQVPSCEYHPDEAIKTNILGSTNVINSAIENKVKRLVLLSTDKAVYPINAMGMTKALAEKVLISKALYHNNPSTILNIIRYGNVIASRGSVVRTFVDQILNKKDITVTNNEMTRFLMSLNDAMSLLCNALQFGKQGEIFVQKAFAAKLRIIAETVLEIFNSKNKIKIIGIRHGEKMHEILVSEEESTKTKNKKNIFIIEPDSRSLNYNIFFDKGKKKNNKFVFSSQNVKLLTKDQLKKILMKESFIKENLK